MHLGRPWSFIHSFIHSDLKMTKLGLWLHSFQEGARLQRHATHGTSGHCCFRLLTAARDQRPPSGCSKPFEALNRGVSEVQSVIQMGGSCGGAGCRGNVSRTAAGGDRSFCAETCRDHISAEGCAPRKGQGRDSGTPSPGQRGRGYPKCHRKFSLKQSQWGLTTYISPTDLLIIFLQILYP